MTGSEGLCISFCHFLSEIMALYRKECYARQQYFVRYVQTPIVMYDECGTEIFWTVIVTTTQLLHINNCYLSLSFYY